MGKVYFRTFTVAGYVSVSNYHAVLAISCRLTVNEIIISHKSVQTSHDWTIRFTRQKRLFYPLIQEYCEYFDDARSGLFFQLFIVLLESFDNCLSVQQLVRYCSYTFITQEVFIRIHQELDQLFCLYAMNTQYKVLMKLFLYSKHQFRLFHPDLLNGISR